MSWIRRSNWYLWSALTAGVLTVSLSMPGCSEPPAPKQEKAEPKKGKVEQPPKPETKPEPKPEPAPEAKPIAKPQAAPEAKPAVETEPKREPKAEVKSEPKPAETSKTAATGDMPAAPKVSTFAPADDLVAQLEKTYVSGPSGLEKAVESEAEYKDQPEGKIIRDANTIILIALGLGLSDQDNKYKVSAGQIIQAAQKLATTTDYASARDAVHQLKGAMAGPAERRYQSKDQLKWAKLASLPQLMKQVPLIAPKLKRNVEKGKLPDAAGISAVLAVIAQGSMPNVSETKKPNEAQKWYGFCAQMRDLAAEVNRAAHAGDKKAASAAYTKLDNSCHDCHAVFHPEEKDAK